VTDSGKGPGGIPTFQVDGPPVGCVEVTPARLYAEPTHNDSDGHATSSIPSAFASHVSSVGGPPSLF
jgi:hypothetical protein